MGEKMEITSLSSAINSGHALGLMSQQRSAFYGDIGWSTIFILFQLIFFQITLLHGYILPFLSLIKRKVLSLKLPSCNKFNVLYYKATPAMFLK